MFRKWQVTSRMVNIKTDPELQFKTEMRFLKRSKRTYSEEIATMKSKVTKNWGQGLERYKKENRPFRIAEKKCLENMNSIRVLDTRNAF